MKVGIIKGGHCMSWKRFKKFIDINFTKQEQNSLPFELAIELYQNYLKLTSIQK